MRRQGNNILIEKILGTCIRHIPSAEKALYLTFDDGPHKQCTTKVLDLLSQHQAQATFFIVANTLQQNLSIGREIVTHGHHVGNHSLDHKYHHFFLNDHHLKKWVEHARDFIEQSLQVPTVGFRSPFGIRTPHLGIALRRLQYPLVHWNQRFYDTQQGLPIHKVGHWVSQFRSGDILLLHDTQSTDHPSFFEGLEVLLKTAHQAGFAFKAVPNNLRFSNGKMITPSSLTT